MIRVAQTKNVKAFVASSFDNFIDFLNVQFQFQKAENDFNLMMFFGSHTWVKLNINFSKNTFNIINSRLWYRHQCILRNSKRHWDLKFIFTNELLLSDKLTATGNRFVCWLAADTCNALDLSDSTAYLSFNRGKSQKKEAEDEEDAGHFFLKCQCKSEAWKGARY